ncbi:MAG TPA: universal stress protein [Gemmataceae bacterium]|jgi:nucleotide-binding universal stress UspA family protein
MLRVRSILHPTDFSDNSAAALELAGAVARDYGARLVIVHVKPPPVVASGVMTPEPPDPPEHAAELRRRLDTCGPATPGVPVEHVMLAGDAAAEIVRLATDEGFDLIVLGTHGRTGLGRLVMGSVAEKVLRWAPCPVLTVKRPVPTAEAEPEPLAVARLSVAIGLTAGGAR